MGRFNWDRLRRVRPLDGADPRLDPDGAVMWERAGEPTAPPPESPKTTPGVRRLRHGVVVRSLKQRRSEAREAADDRTVDTPQAHEPDASPNVECPRCQKRVPRRKLLRHARRDCPRRAR